MGNMLPCLVVQQGTAAGALPAMNPNKRRLISLKFLMKAIHNHKTRKKRPEIDSKSSSSAADDDGKGGEEVLEAARSSSKAKRTNNPKGAVLRSRLHGQRSGPGLGKKGKQGVVRVKVVLTKEEAARLLSLSVGGGGQKHTTAA